MMKELSMHILDIAENSISAGANFIDISIKEDYKRDILEICIKDNGKGINGRILKKIDDPFFTTKSKKVGLGISLLKETCDMCDGSLAIDSSLGKGTLIKAKLRLDHIDLPPLGDMVTTIIALILRGNVDIRYSHKVDEKKFFFDTGKIKEELEGVPINHPKVLNYLKEEIEKGLKEISAGKYMWRDSYAKAYNRGS